MVTKICRPHKSCHVVWVIPREQEARLFGPALFEAAKLKVLFLGAEKEHPDELPRIYTLTHSDITSKITLAISREINKAQVLEVGIIYNSFSCILDFE